MPLRQLGYFFLRFDPPEPFLEVAFFATLAVFLGDFFAPFLVAFLEDGGEALPPEKMLSQLSEYCFVAPTRTTLMADLCSREICC